MTDETIVYFLSALNPGIKYKERVNHWRSIQEGSGRSEFDFWQQLNQCRKWLENQFEENNGIIDGNGKALFFHSLPILQISNGFFLGDFTRDDLTDLTRSLVEYTNTIFEIPTGNDDPKEIEPKVYLIYLHKKGYNREKCKKIFCKVFPKKTFGNTYPEVIRFLDNTALLSDREHMSWETYLMRTSDPDCIKQILKNLKLPYSG